MMSFFIHQVHFSSGLTEEREFIISKLNVNIGSKYYYTTHGWTVVSAIVEKITETPFPKHAQNMFRHWGLNTTYLDEHEPIIYDRARYNNNCRNQTTAKS